MSEVFWPDASYYTRGGDAEDRINSLDGPDDESGLEGDDDEWECAFPEHCIMQGLHHRSECHTAEDAEEAFARAMRENP